MVIDEYLVSYEGYCDPEYNSCFVECEDDECTSEYYFSVIERGANTVKNLCGENILECEEAEYCQDDEINCSITFCDPVIDGEGSCVYTPKNKNL